MNATRRQYLQRISATGALAVVGLAGCLADEPDRTDGGAGTPTPAPDELPGGGGTDTGGDGAGDTRPRGTGGPGISLVAVDEGTDIAVQPTVEIVREAATTESPPRLRTTLTNTGDEPVRVGEGRSVHFEYVTDEDGALIWLPVESDAEWPAEPDCWRLTEAIAVTEEYRTFEIPAGESVHRAVDLYGTPGPDSCLPVGEYRFETTISIVGPKDRERSATDWGFSIVLE